MTFHDLKPLQGKPIKNAVIFLHGYGADGSDLISIGNQWQKELPSTYFFSPDAPTPFEGGGLSGRQWFSLKDHSPSSLAQGVQCAKPLIQNLIHQVKKSHNLIHSQVALVGFSQGAMVSLSYALHTPHKLAGVISYSGCHVPEPPPLVSKPPILMIHGQDDSVLPIHLFHESQQRLEKLGAPVTGHVREKLGHGIDEWGLERGLKFLKEVFVN